MQLYSYPMAYKPFDNMQLNILGAVGLIYLIYSKFPFLTFAERGLLKSTPEMSIQK
jgi:hypothetical protein